MSKTIAISTGGGDAPGLNAVIRSAVLSAHQKVGNALAYAMDSMDFCLLMNSRNMVVVLLN